MEEIDVGESSVVLWQKVTGPSVTLAMALASKKGINANAAKVMVSCMLDQGKFTKRGACYVQSEREDDKCHPIPAG